MIQGLHIMIFHSWVNIKNKLCNLFRWDPNYSLNKTEQISSSCIFENHCFSKRITQQPQQWKNDPFFTSKYLKCWFKIRSWSSGLVCAWCSTYGFLFRAMNDFCIMQRLIDDIVDKHYTLRLWKRAKEKEWKNSWKMMHCCDPKRKFLPASNEFRGYRNLFLRTD